MIRLSVNDDDVIQNTPKGNHMRMLMVIPSVSAADAEPSKAASRPIVSRWLFPDNET